MSKRFFLAAAAALATTAAAAQECAIDFDKDIQSILNRRCASCHNDLSKGGDLTLQKDSSRAAIVNVPAGQLPSMVLVAPGDLDNSYLHRKLVGTHVDAGGSGEAMPLGGRMPPAQLAKIEEWILTCASAES